MLNAVEDASTPVLKRFAAVVQCPRILRKQSAQGASQTSREKEEQANKTSNGNDIYTLNLHLQNDCLICLSAHIIQLIVPRTARRNLFSTLSSPFLCLFTNPLTHPLLFPIYLLTSNSSSAFLLNNLCSSASSPPHHSRHFSTNGTTS